MLQQLFLFLADYIVICAQSFHMTVATDTLSGNLMDGNFGCCPALVRLLFKCTHELLISMNKLAQPFKERERERESSGQKQTAPKTKAITSLQKQSPIALNIYQGVERSTPHLNTVRHSYCKMERSLFLLFWGVSVKLEGQAGTPLTRGQGKGQTVSLDSALPLAPLADSQASKSILV